MCDAAPHFMREVVLVFLLSACGGAAKPARPAPSPPTAPIAKRPHVVQPFELVLRGAPAVGVQRAVIAHYGSAWLRLDGEPKASPGWGTPTATAIAVAEVRDDRVRILHDDDDARVLLWIERDALATVTRREVGLLAAVGEPAPVRGGPGVTIAAGTVVQILGDVGDHHVIEVSADDLHVSGVLADDAIGDLWDSVPATEPPDPSHWMARGTTIHAEPHAGAPVLAETREPVEVEIHGDAQDGWREIETAGPSIVVRGFVFADRVSADPSWGSHGTGSGHGYGASHRISVEVPAGACLYDRIGGEVIGVNTVARTRLAHHGDEPGWWYVIVGSPWGLLDLAAHAPGSTDDPRWELCL